MATGKQHQLLFQLAAKLGPDFSRSFQGAANTMKSLQKTAQEANNKIKDISSYQKQQKAVKNSSGKVAELEKEHARLTDAIKKQGQETPKLTQQLQKNEKSLNAAREAARKQAETLGDMGKALQQAGINTDRLDKENEKLRKTYDRLAESQRKTVEISEKQGKNSEGIKKTAKQLFGIAGAVTAIGAAIYAGPVQNAIEFRQGIAKVSTIADATIVPMETMSKEIVALSNATGEWVTDLSENVYNAISGGQDTADAVNFVAQATKLSTAGFAESAQSVDVLTTVLNAYGMEASKVSDISDMLIQTQNKGKTTVGELAGYMGKIIPTAKGNNVALEQVCTAYAKMTANGIATAESTTYLNGMINELGKNGTQTDKLLRKVAGKSFAELMQSGNSLADVLQIVQDQAKKGGLSLSDMFSSSEAAKAATTLMKDGAEGFNEGVQEMVASCGATEQAYAKMMDTTEAKVKRAKNSIGNLGMVLGDMVLPYVAQTAESVADVIARFSEFAQKNPETIKTIAKVAASLVGVAAGGKVAKIGFLTVQNGVLSLQKGMTALKGLGIAKGLGSLSGGFGGIVTKMLPIVGIVGAIGGGLYMLTTHLEDVRGFIQKTFGAEALAVFDKAWGVITQVGDAIKGAFGGSLSGGILDSLKALLPQIVETIKNGILTSLPLIIQTVQTILPMLAQVASTVLPVLGNLLGTVAMLLGNLVAAVLPVIVQLINALVPVILQIVSAVLPVFINLMRTILPIFTNLIDAVLPVIIQLINTLMPVIQTIIDAVLPVFINLLNTIMPIFQTIIDAILPPLTMLFAALTPVIQVLAEIFSGVLGAALNSIVSIIQNVMGIFQGLIDFVTGVFTGNWQQAWDGVKKIFSNVFEGLQTIVKAPINFIIGGINKMIAGINKIKIPEWVPAIGGKGFNIPEIPAFYKGTDRTPDTFIAGERGAELITNAKNRAVFTAAQTGRIFDNLSRPETKPAAISVTPGRQSGPITVQVTNSPTVVVQGGDTEGLERELQQINAEFAQKVEETVRRVLSGQKEQEERTAYA